MKVLQGCLYLLSPPRQTGKGLWQGAAPRNAQGSGSTSGV